MAICGNALPERPCSTVGDVACRGSDAVLRGDVSGGFWSECSTTYANGSIWPSDAIPSRPVRAARLLVCVPRRDTADRYTLGERARPVRLC